MGKAEKYYVSFESDNVLVRSKVKMSYLLHLKDEENRFNHDRNEKIPNY